MKLKCIKLLFGNPKNTQLFIRKTNIIKVNEIFHSIQGESSFTGLPCIFIRLTGCNLKCNYCDTKYAKNQGKHLSIKSILAAVEHYNCNLVEITGGEPLLQIDVYKLINSLITDNYKVLIETNGSQNIKSLPTGVIKIIDWKTPGSNEGQSFCLDNLEYLVNNDEIKFVISDYDDYKWSVNNIIQNNLNEKFTVLMSAANGILDPAKLYQWIINDNLDVRFQLQLHKYIWPNNEKGR